MTRETESRCPLREGLARNDIQKLADRVSSSFQAAALESSYRAYLAGLEVVDGHPEETGRISRTKRLYAITVEAFPIEKDGAQFLANPHVSLGGETPFEVGIRSDADLTRVISLIAAGEAR